MHKKQYENVEVIIIDEIDVLFASFNDDSNYITDTDDFDLTGGVYNE